MEKLRVYYQMNCPFFRKTVALVQALEQEGFTVAEIDPSSSRVNVKLSTLPSIEYRRDGTSIFVMDCREEADVDPDVLLGPEGALSREKLDEHYQAYLDWKEEQEQAAEAEKQAQKDEQKEIKRLHKALKKNSSIDNDLKKAIVGLLQRLEGKRLHEGVDDE